MGRRKKSTEQESESQSMAAVAEVIDLGPQNQDEMKLEWERLQAELKSERQKFGEWKDTLDLPIFQKLLDDMHVEIEAKKDDLADPETSDKEVKNLRAEIKARRDLRARLQTLMSDAKIVELKAKIQEFRDRYPLLVQSYDAPTESQITDEPPAEEKGQEPETATDDEPIGETAPSPPEPPTKSKFKRGNAIPAPPA